MSDSSRILRDGDDIACARRLCSGDEAALNALLGRYYQPLVNFVLRYVDSQDMAEDVVQELFVRLWERRTAWGLSGTVRAYLYTAARNAALNALASRVARARVEQSAREGEEIASSSFMASQSVEIEELRSAIAAAIATLPARSREVFVLSRDHGLSYEEIATTLGVAQSTVRNQLARALALLEKKLAPFLVGLYILLSP